MSNSDMAAFVAIVLLSIVLGMTLGYPYGLKVGANTIKTHIVTNHELTVVSGPFSRTYQCKEDSSAD